MEQSHSGEADNYSSGQEIHTKNLKIRSSVYMSRPLASVYSQKDPVRKLPSCFYDYFNIILSFTSESSGLLPPDKNVMYYLHQLD
jgi:hypothetical protein